MNRIYLLFLFIWLASQHLTAQPGSRAAIFNQHTLRLDLRPFCQIYVDKTVSMSVAEVSAKYVAGEFIPLDSLRLASKYEAGKYNYWLHFRVKNASPDTLRPVFNLGSSEIFSIYSVSENWKEVAKGGKKLTYCPDCWQRPLPSRLSDDLLLSPGSEEVYFVMLRFKFTPTPLLPILSDPHQELTDFVRNTAAYYACHAFFFIFLVSILLISLLQFFFNRESIYLYYALYVVATLAFFWRSFEVDDPIITVLRHFVDIKDYAFYTPLNLFVMFSYLLLIERLIEARQKYPEIWRMLRFGMPYLLFFLTVDRLALWYDFRLAWRVGPYFRLFFLGYCIFILFRLFRLRANPVVRYVLIGTAMLLVFSISNTLFGLSKIQYWGNFDRSLLSNQIGVILETLYFFVAMGYRSRWLDQENHRMETTLLLREKETEQLKSLDNIKSRLFANFTHEFRTPLTLIMGLAQKAENEGKPLEIKDIKTIRRNGERILQLVNQVLDLAKLDAGTLRLHETSGDLMAELRYTVASFESLAALKKVKLVFRSDSNTLPTVFDHEKLRQVVSNLVANAIKFTPGGGEVSVAVSNNSFTHHSFNGGGSSIAIMVSDTGHGIMPEHLGRVFERFYQIENGQGNVVEGTGIGLAIVKEFTELMDGQVSMRSEVGKGTAFEILLPIIPSPVVVVTAEKPVEAVVLTEPSPLPLLPAIGEGSTVILIIEDNLDVAGYVAKSLSARRSFNQAGQYSFLFATDGKQGWEQATAHTPDLIVSDVMMPEIDGYTLCRMLKNDPRTDHIPLMLLTARADHDSKLTGLRERADVYLTKPFEAEELALQVHNLLERQRVLRERFGQFPASYSSDGSKLSDESLPPSPEEIFMAHLRVLLEAKAFDAQYSVQPLCRDMGMSASNLHRKLTAIAGKSAVELIQATRLERGKSLLVSSQKRVTEIAFECGFNDPDYFSRAFSKRFGVSPKRLREQVLGEKSA